LKRKVIFIGTVNSAPAVPRDILAQSVRLMATGILVVHNHPSGNPEPSDADIDFTHDLNQSCKMLGTSLVDHLIVGRNKYYSFREKNLL
jgi:DNA repair protein RadC